MRLLAILFSLTLLLTPAKLPSQPLPATRSVRFTIVDVQIDPHGQPLAAYQVEFVAPPEVKLVGIEGGDHAAFKDPPYYDPVALSRSRVILAAFNTGSDLPKTAFRAARLHVQVESSQPNPQWTVKLIVASTADGTRIPAATASLSQASEGAKP